MLNFDEIKKNEILATAGFEPQDNDRMFIISKDGEEIGRLRLSGSVCSEIVLKESNEDVHRELYNFLCNISCTWVYNYTKYQMTYLDDCDIIVKNYLKNENNQIDVRNDIFVRSIGNRLFFKNEVIFNHNCVMVQSGTGPIMIKSDEDIIIYIGNYNISCDEDMDMLNYYMFVFGDILIENMEDEEISSEIFRLHKIFGDLIVAKYNYVYTTIDYISGNLEIGESAKVDVPELMHIDGNIILKKGAVIEAPELLDVEGDIEIQDITSELNVQPLRKLGGALIAKPDIFKNISDKFINIR
jgi:hypothetical protein